MISHNVIHPSLGGHSVPSMGKALGLGENEPSHPQLVWNVAVKAKSLRSWSEHWVGGLASSSWHHHSLAG